MFTKYNPETWAGNRHTQSIEILQWLMTAQILLFKISAVESEIQKGEKRVRMWRGIYSWLHVCCFAWVVMHIAIAPWCFIVVDICWGLQKQTHFLLWVRTLWTRWYSQSSGFKINIIEGFSLSKSKVSLHPYTEGVSYECVWSYLSVSGGHTGQRSLNKGRLAGRHREKRKAVWKVFSVCGQ